MSPEIKKLRKDYSDYLCWLGFAGNLLGNLTTMRLKVFIKDNHLNVQKKKNRRYIALEDVINFRELRATSNVKRIKTIDDEQFIKIFKKALKQPHRKIYYESLN